MELIIWFIYFDPIYIIVFKDIYNANGLPHWLSDKESTCSAGDTGDMASALDGEDALEKEMATHSSILAWEIPRIEEPDGLQSMESQKVEHNWSDLAHTHT